MILPGFETRHSIPARQRAMGPIFASILAGLLAAASQTVRSQEEGAQPPPSGTPTAATATQPAPAPEQAAPAPGPVPSPPQAPLPTDGEIRARVEEALSRDTGIAGHGTFRVACEEGIVTLTGSAETLSVLRQAERRAGDILGVLDVVITCNISTAGALDSRILLEIQRALELPAFRGDSISAAVTDGYVQLRGTTATYARKLLAERGASEAPGAVSVQNNLRVTAPSEGDDAALAWRIRLLLTGGLTPIPGRFDVTVSRREAILRGEVPLYSHRIQAERLALSVGGILGVQNRLKVNPSLDLPALPSRNVP